MEAQSILHEYHVAIPPNFPAKLRPHAASVGAFRNAPRGGVGFEALSCLRATRHSALARDKPHRRSCSSKYALWLASSPAVLGASESRLIKLDCELHIITTLSTKLTPLSTRIFAACLVGFGLRPRF
eukprot:1620423-Amphidinium_carterae.1